MDLRSSKATRRSGESGAPPHAACNRCIKKEVTIRWYRNVNLLRANIDACRIRLQHHRSPLPLLSSLRHGLLLVAGERGPRRESLQSPDRDRCTAPQTSSLTYPLSQTHASRRAHQAPMPTSGRSCHRLQPTYHRSPQVPYVPI